MAASTGQLVSNACVQNARYKNSMRIRHLSNPRFRQKSCFFQQRKARLLRNLSLPRLREARASAIAMDRGGSFYTGPA